LTESIIKDLQKQSQARVKKDPEFAKIEKELKESEEKKGIVKLADVMKKTEETNKKEKNKKKSKADKEAEYVNQPAVQESLSVAVDLANRIKSEVMIAKDPTTAAVSEKTKDKKN
jgi:hypothetical protein